MTRQPLTTDITGQLILLGTGTSVGVPTIGCGCGVCQSKNPKNQRTRCSVVIGLGEGTLLVDTSPDLRQQLLREKIGVIDAVLYTHEHADHLFGLDDLRIMQFYLGHAVPLWCEERVERRIRKSFDYAFTSHEETHQGATPQLTFHRIDDSPFKLLGARILPIPMHHGPQFDVYGFRIGNVAYCTDTNGIPPASMSLLDRLDVLILGALRHRAHPTHFNLQQAIEVSRTLSPKRTIFTHISHEMDHDPTNLQLPNGMELGFDGMQIPLS